MPRICHLKLEHTLHESQASRVVLCSCDGRPYVVKMTRLADDDAPQICGRPACASSAQRARREAELLCELRDVPSVIVSHGWISTARVGALLLDYLPGGSLASIMGRNGALGHQSARFYIAQVALALEALHQRRVAHRDIKPDNVCISASGHSVLVDFGFARRFEVRRDTRFNYVSQS